MIKELISQMSFEEKTGMLTFDGYSSTLAIERLNIPSLNVADGPHGVRFTGKAAEGGSVCYPTASALAATWNREMAYIAGQAVGLDCILHNVDVLCAPGVNIKRTPLCGRNFEYYSEDPLLTGELAAAYINGLQAQGVAACIKHFAANNQETDRSTISSEVDERTLREIYLKPFEIAIKKSNPKSIMSAYNKLNGIYCSENRWLLKDLLREEWGYTGAVISDWIAVNSISRSIAAGLNLQMPANKEITKRLREGIKQGLVTEEDINGALEILLKFVLDMRDSIKNRSNEEYSRSRQHARAKEIADEAITLLKNEDNILPIDKARFKKIIVLGGFADNPNMMGGGSSSVRVVKEHIESPLDYIRQYAGEGVEVVYDELYTKNVPGTGSFQFNARGLVKECGDSDLVIFFAGTPKLETESLDRYTTYFENYIDASINYACKYTTNIIVVIQTGGAMTPLKWHNSVKGIIQMWLCGEAGGSSIADVLFGRVNPSGKLPETYMLKLNGDMDFPGDSKKVCYNEKWAVGYRYYDRKKEDVWYSFGHGLSYTKYEYSNLIITPESSDDPDCQVNVKADIRNSGEWAGKEIVQLYIRDTGSEVSKPGKELKEFTKILLQPGETKTVEFNLDRSAFSYYSTMLKKWHARAGTYEILIGASSDDIRLTGRYTLSVKNNYTVDRVLPFLNSEIP